MLLTLLVLMTLFVAYSNGANQSCSNEWRQLPALHGSFDELGGGTRSAAHHKPT